MVLQAICLVLRDPKSDSYWVVLTLLVLLEEALLLFIPVKGVSIDTALARADAEDDELKILLVRHRGRKEAVAFEFLVAVEFKRGLGGSNGREDEEEGVAAATERVPLLFVLFKFPAPSSCCDGRKGEVVLVPVVPIPLISLEMRSLIDVSKSAASMVSVLFL